MIPCPVVLDVYLIYRRLWIVRTLILKSLWQALTFPFFGRVGRYTSFAIYYYNIIIFCSLNNPVIQWLRFIVKMQINEPLWGYKISVLLLFCFCFYCVMTKIENVKNDRNGLMFIISKSILFFQMFNCNHGIYYNNNNI